MKVLKSKKAVAAAVAIVNTASTEAIGSLVRLSSKEVDLIETTEATPADRKAFASLRKDIVTGLTDNGYVDAIGANPNTVTGHVNRWLASIAGIEKPTVKSASDYFVSAGLTVARSTKGGGGGKPPQKDRTQSAVCKEIAAMLRRNKKFLKAMTPMERHELAQIILSV